MSVSGDACGQDPLRQSGGRPEEEDVMTPEEDEAMTTRERASIRAEAFREAAEAVSRSLAITGDGTYRGALDGHRWTSGICEGSSCCPDCHDRDRRTLNALADREMGR